VFKRKRKRKQLDGDQVVKDTHNSDEVVVVKRNGAISGYIREKKWPKRSLYGIVATCLLVVGFWIGVSEFDWLTPTVSVDTASQEVVIGMSENLTSQLLGDGIAHQNSDYIAKGATLTSMRETAAQRQQYIERLMRENPDEFLRIALPPDVQSELFYDVESIERPVTLTGTLDIIDCGEEEEDEDGNTYHSTDLFLNLPSGEVKQVFLPKSIPVNYQANDKVQITGYELGDLVVPNIIADTDNFVVTAAAALEPTGTKRQVAVILVNIKGAAISSTFTKANALKTLEASDQWYREASYGKIYLAGKNNPSQSADVFGIYEVTNASNGTCESSYSGWHTQGRAAAAADGFNITGYQHVIVMINGSSGCGWSGRGSVGGSSIWQIGATSALVTVHEMGHNLGLSHAARSYTCKVGGQTTVFGNPGTDCTSFIEYGDYYDAMGNSSSRGTPAPHFSATNKSKLGWIPAANVKTVTASGTYDLYPSEAASSGTQLIRIQMPYNVTRPSSTTSPNGSAPYYYYIELRKPIGAESGISATYKDDYNGVFVRVGSGTTYSLSYLFALGTLPGAEVCIRCATGLRPGMVFTDPNNPNLSIEVTSYTQDKATLNIKLGNSVTPPPTPVCTRNNPTISINPASGKAEPGKAISYAVTVKSNDSQDCASATYTVTPSASTSGFTFSPTSRAWTLTPGSTGTSQSFSITSPSTIANGNYTITFRVTNSANSNAVTQNVTYTVERPAPVCTRNNPTISINPTSGSATSGGKIDYAVTVKNNDSSGCANATFTVNPSSTTSGFTYSPTSKAWTLAPGATSASQTFSVTSPSSLAAGNYAITFKVTNNANSNVVNQNVTYTVTGAAPVCTRNNPTITINPTSGSAAPGVKVDYAVTVKNNDSTACASATYTVTPSSGTSGFTYSPTSKAWTLAPGATSASQTFSVTSPSSLANGNYTITFRVTNSANSNAVTQSVTYTAVKPVQVCTRNNPTITISPTSGKVTPGGKIDYSVTVKSNDSQDCESITYIVTPSSSASGFNFSPTSKSWSINPGATSSSQTFSVTSPSNIANGTYTMSFKVTNSANSTSVTQNVSFTVSAPVVVCVRNNPTVTVNPTSGKAEPGGKIDYVITVKNNDSQDCTNANFNITAAMSNNSTKGFAFSPSSKSLSLTPGASASQTFTVTAPNVNDGIHTVVIKVAHSGDSKKTAQQNVSFIIAKTNTGGGNTGGGNGGGTTSPVPPSVSISGIKDGETLKANGNTKITINSSHSAGIAKIEIFIDEKLVATCDNPKNGACDIQIKGQDTKAGDHIIKATATAKDTAKSTHSASLLFKK